MTTQSPELTRTLDASANATLANQLVTEAVVAPVTTPSVPIPAVEPPDTSVTLMVGLLDAMGQPSKDAVVRELNGADEEALTSPALLRNPAKYLSSIAQRGTVSIGDKAVTSRDIESLLIGDREMLLIAIRRATYGDDLELITTCPHCDAVDTKYVFDLTTVGHRDLGRIEDAVFGIQVELSSGRTARIGLPTAADQDAVVSAENKSLGELNTLMLSRCLKELDGSPVLRPVSELQKLSVRDRRKMLQVITDESPGPRLGEVKRVCDACEQEFDLNIGLLDIFRA